MVPEKRRTRIAGGKFELPMREVVTNIETKLAALSGKGKTYVEYCRQVVYINFLRICKQPELAHSICEKLRLMESNADMPYTSVDRYMSLNSRKITQCMATMMYRLSHKWMAESMDGEEETINDENMHQMENFMATMSPHLEGSVSDREQHHTANQRADGIQEHRRNHQQNGHHEHVVYK